MAAGDGLREAQQPINVIPAHQPPLAKTFPPQPSEQTPTGIGKFVIFTREDLGKTGQWDFIAGAWECIPSRTNVPITKRISEGKIEFAAQLEKPGSTETVWTIEIASGKITETVRPHRAPPEPDFATFDGVPAPEYLRPYLKNLRHFGRGGLAPAFLMHMGVLKKQPEFPDCEAAVSNDGRHIFYKAKKGPLSNVFIYGDTQTKRILRWQTPEALRAADSMEFVWVETP